MSKTTRLLSLILVIAMAFSLFAVSGSAKWADVAKTTYTDYKTGNYKEAIDVLTYINVIDGIEEDGGKAFKPEGTLQRDAAAKIISRLITGVSAEDIGGTSTSFSDVPKTQWASGYIQWAYNNNIVNGMGDGTFNPTGSVTVLQFLKMILTGLGWGAQGEFTGKGWDSAVYIKATELELWGDVTPVVTDRPATREEAMEFALQALELSKVYLNNAYDYMFVDGTKAYGNNLVEPIYILHNLELVGDSDKIGYLTYQWLDAKTGYKIYEGLQKYNKQLPLLPTTKAADLLTGVTTASVADVYLNGVRIDTLDSKIKQTDFVKYYGLTFAGATITSYRGTGRTLARIVIEMEYAAKVTSVSATAKTFTMEVYAGLATTTKAAAQVKGYSGLDNTDKEYVVGDILAVVPVLKDTIGYAEFGTSGTYSYYQVLSTEASDFADGIDNIAKTAKATLGGTYGGKYVYNVPEYNSELRLTTYLLTGKQTFEAATLSAAKAKDATTDDFTKAKNDATYGLNGIIYLSSGGAILRYIGAATAEAVKYAFLGDITKSKYDRETNTAAFSITAIGNFDIFDKDGAIIETLGSIYEGSTFGGAVSVDSNTLIGYFEANASTYAPARWQTVAKEATPPTVFEFTTDGYLETGVGASSNIYALATGAFVVDVTKPTEIVYGATVRGFDETKGEIKALYLNAAKTKVMGVIITKYAVPTALGYAIDEAEALNEADYTADAWTTFQTVLAAAKAVYAEYAANDQEEIDAAKAALAAAITAVKKNPSPTKVVTIATIAEDYADFATLSNDDAYLFANVIDSSFAVTAELDQAALKAALASVGRTTGVDVTVTFDESFNAEYDLSGLASTEYGILASTYGFYAIAVPKA